jgi:FkbM family methyltransferase
VTSRASALLRGIIGRNRRSAPVKALHRLAGLVESAYFNEGASFETNGERRLIERLGRADFRIAFDVGANHGDWSLHALGAWPQCRIHAFEVAPPTYEALVSKVAASKHASRMTLNCLGLSDTDSTQEMFYFPHHPELTCDLRRHVEYEMVPFEARLASGDAYASEHQLDAVDFVKIDVEGSEHRVLRGLGSRLSSAKIHCLQFEYGAFSTQTRVLLADYYSLLSRNYWLGKIYPDYVEFTEYDWRLEDFRFANYCGVSKSRPELRDLLT